MIDGKRKRKTRNLKPHFPPEAKEQELLFAWAKLAAGRYPELSLMFHIPNGGGRNPREGRAFKRRGVKAGMPDICLPVSRNGSGSLYIELKRIGAGKRTSPAQDVVMDALKLAGNAVHVCEGWESAKLVIEDYLR